MSSLALTCLLVVLLLAGHGQGVFSDVCHVVTPINTSNKKHFMKNVKECRDVNRQKSIRTRLGCYRHTSHTLWTHSIVRIVRAL